MISLTLWSKMTITQHSTITLWVLSTFRMSVPYFACSSRVPDTLIQIIHADKTTMHIIFLKRNICYHLHCSHLGIKSYFLRRTGVSSFCHFFFFLYKRGFLFYPRERKWSLLGIELSSSFKGRGYFGETFSEPSVYLHSKSGRWFRRISGLRIQEPGT